MSRRRSGRSPSPHGSSCTFAIRQLYAGILRTTGRHSHTACVGVTERLGRASSRHPWRTILAWVGAIVVALALSAALLPGNLTTEGHVTGSPESARAERAFLSRFPPDRNAVDELVVVRSETLTSRDPAFRQFGARLLAQARATGVVHRERVLAVSKDRHAVLIGIQRKADVDDLLPVVERADGQDGFSVAMTGEGTLDHDFNEASQHDLESGELQFGLPAALIILLLVFGAVVAGLIPLVMAMIAIVVALGLLREHAHGHGSRPRDRLLALRRLPVSRGARRRARRARRDRRLERDREPRRPVQRLRLRDRAHRNVARALEHHEEPGRRGDRGRDRVGVRGADAAARAAGAARRPRERAAAALRRPVDRRRWRGALLGRRRTRRDAAADRLPRRLLGVADRARDPDD